jgi:transposase-like protein
LVTHVLDQRKRAVRWRWHTATSATRSGDAMRQIAEKLGIGSTETLRKWIRQA